MNKNAQGMVQVWGRKTNKAFVIRIRIRKITGRKEKKRASAHGHQGHPRRGGTGESPRVPWGEGEGAHAMTMTFDRLRAAATGALRRAAELSTWHARSPESHAAKFMTSDRCSGATLGCIGLHIFCYLVPLFGSEYFISLCLKFKKLSIPMILFVIYISLPD